jgi:hypothetical protein
MLTRQKRKLLNDRMEAQGYDLAEEPMLKRAKNFTFVIESESEEESECENSHDTLTTAWIRKEEEALERLSCPIAPLIREGWGDAFGVIRKIMDEVEGLRVPAMAPHVWAQWTIANPEMQIEWGFYGRKTDGAVCDACGRRRDLTMLMRREDTRLCVGSECGRRIDLAQRMWVWAMRAAGEKDKGDMSAKRHQRAYEALVRELCEGGYAWEME